jgi:hypothetical protein
MDDIPHINGIGSIPADAGRRQDRGQRDTPGRKPSPDAKRAPATIVDDYQPAAADEPTAALVEALDRLRATHALSPAEETTRRMLRGQRYYQERRPTPATEDIDVLFRDHEGS